jgi:prepilin-type N-terminal cleavage/methylation domain-containing protein
MRGLLKHRQKRNIYSFIKNNNGFSLLEVLIGMVILAIIVTPMLVLFTSSLQTTLVSQDLLDGAYIAQDVYENIVAQDYDSLLSTSSAKALYDSDGDGENDCYVQRNIYPDGVYADLTPTENPSYVHINIIDEQVKIIGSSGTDDSSNSGTKVTSIGDITLNNSSLSETVTVTVGSSASMTFKKKYASCPLVVIVNIYQKKVGSQTISLTISGDTSYTYVVEYARKSNFEELSCAQLSTSNIYYGVNDHTTTLLHSSVQVFDISDATKRIGFVEGTFEVSLS